MTNWMKVGTDVVVGGGVGAIDQIVQNADDKRIDDAIAGGKTPPGLMGRFGTYYNFGVPILAIFGTAFGFLKGDWATRTIVAGSQLAGRKVTRIMTLEKNTRPRWRAVTPRTRTALETRSPAAQVGGDYSPVGIPVITNETVLV